MTGLTSDGLASISDFPKRIQEYSREKAKDLGKERRKCWVATNPLGETVVYALYSGPRGSDRTIVTLAYLKPGVGWQKIYDFGIA